MTDTSKISENDALEVDVLDKKIVLKNITKKTVEQLPPFPDQMLKIINAGGLVKYMQESGF